MERLRLTPSAGRPISLSASLILWAALVVWHLPLVIVGEIHWSDTIFLFGFVVVYNWIFNNTGGSVFITMIVHATNNTISGSFFGPMFSGAESVRQSWFSAAIWCAVALAVVVAAGPKNLSRHHTKPEDWGVRGAERTGANEDA